jgi:hypothetical protein
VKRNLAAFFAFLALSVGVTLLAFAVVKEIAAIFLGSILTAIGLSYVWLTRKS